MHHIIIRGHFLNLFPLMWDRTSCPGGVLPREVNRSVSKRLKDTSVCCPAADTRGHVMHCPRVHQQPRGQWHTPRLRGGGGQRLLSPLTWPALFILMT